MNHKSGYSVVLGDGRREFIAESAQYELKASSDGPMLALRGRGFELAIKTTAVRRFSRIDGDSEVDVAVPHRNGIGHTAPESNQHRVTSSYINPVCGFDIICGGANPGCSAALQSCSLCPDCSAPIPNDGNPIACFVSPCGDGGGGGVGVGVIPIDSTVTCLYDFGEAGLNCGYENANPKPSRPNKNLAIGYLHSTAYVRLACDVSSFNPIPVAGFAVYKDASQVYVKHRDDIGPTPDYWIASDETGKPIPPGPPAHTAITSQYEYLGIPFLVAGHCDGAD